MMSNHMWIVILGSGALTFLPRPTALRCESDAGAILMDAERPARLFNTTHDELDVIGRTMSTVLDRPVRRDADPAPPVTNVQEERLLEEKDDQIPDVLDDRGIQMIAQNPEKAKSLPRTARVDADEALVHLAKRLVLGNSIGPPAASYVDVHAGNPAARTQYALGHVANQTVIARAREMFEGDVSRSCLHGHQLESE